MEISITKPRLAINCWVNTVVCVRKPGPIDELAIKKAAPITAPPAPKEKVLVFVDAFLFLNRSNLNIFLV